MSDTRDRRARYRERMTARGYRQLAAWVPARDLPRVKRYINALSATFEKEQRAAKSGSKEAE